MKLHASFFDSYRGGGIILMTYMYKECSFNLGLLSLWS